MHQLNMNWTKKMHHKLRLGLGKETNDKTAGSDQTKEILGKPKVEDDRETRENKIE